MRCAWQQGAGCSGILLPVQRETWNLSGRSKVEASYSLAYRSVLWVISILAVQLPSNAVYLALELSQHVV